jgi:hypothetical protein
MYLEWLFSVSHLTMVCTSGYQDFLDRHWDVSLYDFLARIHGAIISRWKFKDEGGVRISLSYNEKRPHNASHQILRSDEFKQLMRYLVEDVQESQNNRTSHDTSYVLIK